MCDFRERQNILLFSLDAAEQSLTEVQPHVMTKLIENRTKRLRDLEKAQKVLTNDLDQRSKDICAVRYHHIVSWNML